MSTILDLSSFYFKAIMAYLPTRYGEASHRLLALVALDYLLRPLFGREGSSGRAFPDELIGLELLGTTQFVF